MQVGYLCCKHIFQYEITVTGACNFYYPAMVDYTPHYKHIYLYTVCFVYSNDSKKHNYKYHLLLPGLCKCAFQGVSYALKTIVQKFTMT
ncbi:hypothetical protein GDO86_000602 [Hymenochirus boettgeri]|uniref:Uncharacterized protein n=1 Tax=Hymenochirus boettgeri TaxID=247094 RepID=A0A8T2KEM0_9PIPI|nr:hypothetical protein GDO86_000602 [Hymenochirus boettgeri]